LTSITLPIPKRKISCAISSSPNATGLKKKMSYSLEWLRSMVLIGGPSLLGTSPIEWENNAEKGGSTTWTLPSANKSGQKRKSGNCSWDMN